MTHATTDTTRAPSNWKERVSKAIDRARAEGTIMVTIRDLSILLARTDPEGVRAKGMDWPKTLDHYASHVHTLAAVAA